MNHPCWLATSVRADAVFTSRSTFKVRIGDTRSVATFGSASVGLSYGPLTPGGGGLCLGGLFFIAAAEKAARLVSPSLSAGIISFDGVTYVWMGNVFVEGCCSEHG